jgi:hypothetical protein
VSSLLQRLVAFLNTLSEDVRGGLRKLQWARVSSQMGGLRDRVLVYMGIHICRPASTWHRPFASRIVDFSW